MDIIWHAAILDTKFYADLQQSMGCILHHRPSGASEQEAQQRELRLSTMQDMYRAFFEKDPIALMRRRPRPSPEPASPLRGQAMQVFVKTLTGRVITVSIRPEETINELKWHIQNIEGIPAEEQRLVFAGCKLGSDKTLHEVGIEKESTIHCTLPLRGC